MERRLNKRYTTIDVFVMSSYCVFCFAFVDVFVRSIVQMFARRRGAIYISYIIYFLSIKLSMKKQEKSQWLAILMTVTYWISHLLFGILLWFIMSYGTDLFMGHTMNMALAIASVVFLVYLLFSAIHVLVDLFYILKYKRPLDVVPMLSMTVLLFFIILFV